jgi:hypothetical protein
MHEPHLLREISLLGAASREDAGDVRRPVPGNSRIDLGCLRKYDS